MLRIVLNSFYRFERKFSVWGKHGYVERNFWLLCTRQFSKQYRGCSVYDTARGGRVYGVNCPYTCQGKPGLYRGGVCCNGSIKRSWFVPQRILSAECFTTKQCPIRCSGQGRTHGAIYGSEFPFLQCNKLRSLRRKLLV